jgi:hypothetical protein
MSDGYLKDTELGNLERRRSRRFPIRRKLRVKTSNGRSPVMANGETLNISSSGVFFKSDVDLSVGGLVELYIDWPVKF